MKVKMLLLIIAVFLVCSQVLNADTEPDITVLVKLFQYQGDKVVSLFDDSFLKAVPPAKITEILNQYEKNLGRLLNISGRDGKYTLVFEKGTAPANITLNGNQKIIGLWFGNWALNDDTPQKIVNELKEMPGKVSVCVTKNNQETILAFQENMPMAVGSTFKLFVLKTVYETVRAGKLSWDTVISLNNQKKSLPSGILQDWPDKTPVTLKTLTNLMISISDNTATDHLIDVVGREAIEKYISALNRPFLKTSEMFILKLGKDSKLREEYVKASPEERRTLLKNLNPMDISRIEPSAAPRLIGEIEWFFTTSDLCKAVYELRSCNEIAINPGLAAKDDWKLAAYKGGSEPGVLQYTHLLQPKDGADFYAVSITVNDSKKNIDEAKVSELTVRLINLIRNGKITGK